MYLQLLGVALIIFCVAFLFMTSPFTSGQSGHSLTPFIPIAFFLLPFCIGLKECHSIRAFGFPYETAFLVYNYSIPSDISVYKCDCAPACKA